MFSYYFCLMSRIREAQKHVDSTDSGADPDPQHWFFLCLRTGVYSQIRGIFCVLLPAWTAAVSSSPWQVGLDPFIF